MRRESCQHNVLRSSCIVVYQRVGGTISPGPVAGLSDYVGVYKYVRYSGFGYVRVSVIFSYANVIQGTAYPTVLRNNTYAILGAIESKHLELLIIMLFYSPFC